MSEWVQCRLIDIADIIMGQSPKGDDCNITGLGVPLLNGPTEFGNRHPTPTQFTTEGKKNCIKNDLLFCVRGSTTGRMNWADQSYAIGRGLAAIRSKSSAKVRYFIKGLLDYHLLSILQGATGSTFPNVSRSQLEYLSISVPPLEEQKAISEILSALDDKIELLQKQNETLEAMAQTLFRQWFIVEADDSWEEREIGGFAELIKDSVSPGTNPDKAFEHYSLPAYDNQRSPTIDLGIDIKSNKYKVFNQVILISKLNPGTSRVWLILNEAQDNSICSTEFVVVKPNSQEWHFFIYCLLNSDETSEYLGSCASGTSGSHQRIKPADILNLIFKFDHIDKVKKFSKTVKPFFEKISINKTSIKSLVQTRETLLPKLMSGEVRVKLD